jgi:four helix bundle protein
MSTKRFEDLEIWQVAMQLDKEFIHFIVPLLTTLQDYPLINQMRKSVGSISDNIAEGFERNGNKEFIQFLSIAKGSCGEFRSQLLRCKHRFDHEKLNQLIGLSEELSKKIARFKFHLIDSELRGSKFTRTPDRAGHS